MNNHLLSRRQFLHRSVVAAGAVAFAPAIASSATEAPGPSPKRTAADQVTLGKTGVKLSRLGMGTGSNNGQMQRALGQDGFSRLVHYAYDHGITYFDCAQSYATFGMLGAAIKGLPRDKVFIQSKVMGQPADVLAAVDHHRQTFDTDYVDSLLIHLMTRRGWTDEFKRVMDGFDEARSRKWIRAKGVSCHSLPALRTAAASNWPEVHLVRVNPQGHHLDAEDQGSWNDQIHDVNPVISQIKVMHANGHGVIGMKIIGNGDFTRPEDREKSIRFAMSQPEIDAVVIGMTSTGQIDEAITRVNSALAA